MAAQVRSALFWFYFIMNLTTLTRTGFVVCNKMLTNESLKPFNFNKAHLKKCHSTLKDEKKAHCNDKKQLKGIQFSAQKGNRTPTSYWCWRFVCCCSCKTYLKSLFLVQNFKIVFNSVGPIISTLSNIGSLEKGCFRLNVFVQLFFSIERFRLALEKNNEGFLTSVFRKPTFNGQYFRWDSFGPTKRKINLIKTLVHRA